MISQETVRLIQKEKNREKMEEDIRAIRKDQTLAPGEKKEKTLDRVLMEGHKLLEAIEIAKGI